MRKILLNHILDDISYTKVSLVTNSRRSYYLNNFDTNTA